MPAHLVVTVRGGLAPPSPFSMVSTKTETNSIVVEMKYDHLANCASMALVCKLTVLTAVTFCSFKHDCELIVPVLYTIHASFFLRCNSLSSLSVHT
jgi:hypothetical protein